MKSTAVPLPVCSLLAALVLFSIVGGVPSLLAQTSDFDHKEVAENLAMKLMIEIPDGSEVALRPFHLVDGNILPDEIGEQIYNLLTLELNEAKKTVKVLTRRLIEVYETFQDHAQEKSIEELLRAMQGDIEILCQVRRVKGGLNLSCEAPNLDTGENIGNGGSGYFRLGRRQMFNLVIFELAEEIVRNAAGELADVRFTEKRTGCRTDLGDYLSARLEQYVNEWEDRHRLQRWKSLEGSKSEAVESYDLEGEIWLHGQEEVELIVRIMVGEKRLDTVAETIAVSSLPDGLGARPSADATCDAWTSQQVDDEQVFWDAFGRALDEAPTINVGAQHHGTLSGDLLGPDSGKPLAVWKLSGESGTTLWIDLISSDFDAVLSVLSDDLEESLTDDDSGEGSNAHLTLTIPSGGEVVILVGAYEENGRGEYVLRTQSVDQEQVFWDALDNAPIVDVDGEYHGKVTGGIVLPETRQPIGVWKLNGVAGTPLRIDLVSVDFDPVLYAFANDWLTDDDSGWLTDDDSGEGSNAHLTLTIPSGGEVVILVGAYEENGRGEYVLRTQSVDQEQVFWDALDNAPIVDVDGEYHGKVTGGIVLPETRQPIGVWKLNGVAGTPLRIDLVSVDFDPVLYAFANDWLTDDDSGWLTDDDSGEGSNAHLTLTIPSGGEVVILVGAYEENGRGEYVLRTQSVEGTMTSVDRAKYVRAMERAYELDDFEKVMEYVQLLEENSTELPLKVSYYKGLSYMKLGRFEESSQVLTKYAEQIGEGGEYFDEVVGLLVDLDERMSAEDEAYEWARSRGTTAAYAEYLSAYPNGKHVAEALRLEAEAEDDQAYERARTLDTAGSYAAYLAKHPDGRHAAEARRLRTAAEVQELDDEAYERARGADTAAAYGEYLSAYPSGRHVAEARQSHAEAVRKKEQRPGRRFQDCEVCPELIVVPAGTYFMGSPSSEEDRADDEGPLHQVQIREPFAVGVYEVTRAEFLHFVTDTDHDMSTTCGAKSGFGWRSPGYLQTDRHPVVCVSWQDAQTYMSWLRSLTGEWYRLLTESEWEFVTRAGTETPFHTGETISTDQANYNGNYAYGTGNEGQYRAGTTPVGAFEPNAFGLYDTHGNVWEWIADCFGEYDAVPSDGSASDIGSCRIRGRRGGSWDSEPQYLRSANRAAVLAWKDFLKTGLRVARTFIPDSMRAKDVQAYESAKSQDTVTAYEAYLKRYPEGLHEFDVRRLWTDRLAEVDSELAVDPGSRFRDCEECPEMVVVPAGSYTMGSPPSEHERRDNEGPVHQVRIGDPFAVGIYEVTREEFSRFQSDTGHRSDYPCYSWDGGEWKIRESTTWNAPGYEQTERDPVVCVAWSGARTYVSWLKERTGKEYRLLSEAEWEYVARAGTTTARYWGETEREQCEFANGKDDRNGGETTESCDDGYSWTAPVGSFRANGFGLYDVLGNVSEFVEDCANESYDGAPSDGKAWEKGECRGRMNRGGSFGSVSEDLRSAFRTSAGAATYFAGFRVARTLRS